MSPTPRGRQSFTSRKEIKKYTSREDSGSWVSILIGLKEEPVRGDTMGTLSSPLLEAAATLTSCGVFGVDTSS